MTSYQYQLTFDRPVSVPHRSTRVGAIRPDGVMHDAIAREAVRVLASVILLVVLAAVVALTVGYAGGTGGSPSPAPFGTL